MRLCEGLLDGIASGFLRGTGWMAHGLMHALGDPEVVKMLSVGEGRGRIRISSMSVILRGALGNPVTRAPTRFVINRVGRRILAPYFQLGRSKPFRRPPLHAGEVGERGEVIERVHWPTGCELSSPPPGEEAGLPGLRSAWG